MYNFIITIGGIIIILVLIELLELPDWLGRKLRGKMPSKEVEEKIRTLENRIGELEKKIKH
jgi:predicted DNA-binding transcriptional regulator